MAITLPSIEIIFKKLASNFIERSERGIAILIVKDDTNITFTTKTYKKTSELEADIALYTATNYQYIADTLSFAANKVVVVRIATTETMTDALTIIESTVKTGWITTVGEAADYTTIINWVKAKELAGETYQTVVYNATTPDNKHVINFANTSVVFNDTRATQTGDKYLPSLIGILAACNVDRGSTYFVCNNLLAVTEVADNNVALNAGQLILINDFDNVKIGLGINSLTTFTATNVEDMRYIDTVEAMDLMVDDIKNTWSNDFVGKYKNNYNNQILFISAINTYFKALTDAEILDNGYKNYADVDVVTQKAAWVLIKPEAETWDDATVRNNTYKRIVFLGGDVKILGAMENLKFNISIF